MIEHDVPQGTAEWHRLRANKPTASCFSKLVTSKGEPSKSLPGYALTLAVEKLVGEPVDAFEGNNWTERGNELEPEARETYKLIRDVEVREVGFVTDDAEQYGCSPDGLVGDDGVNEFKCLKAENHIKAILYYKKNGCPPPEYVAQCQGEMFVCERQFVDLVFYHPKLDPLIIRQTPNADFVAMLRKQIIAVIAERDRILEALKA